MFFKIIWKLWNFSENVLKIKFLFFWKYEWKCFEYIFLKMFWKLWKFLKFEFFLKIMENGENEQFIFLENDLKIEKNVMKMIWKWIKNVSIYEIL